KRRQYSRPKLEIVKPTCPFKPGTLTGSTEQHSFSLIKSGAMIPSTMFSKLSILEEEKNKESAIPELNSQEEKAIKELQFICIHHDGLNQDTLNQSCLPCAL
ncbi:vq motif-containing protein 31, partial [Quercus suber]